MMRVVVLACLLVGTWGDDTAEALSLLQARAQVLSRRGTATHVPTHKSNKLAKAARHRFADASKGIVRLLDFTQATVVYNNLGGAGPHQVLPSGEAAPEEIRYRNLVARSNVDLVITAADGYEPYNADRNGIFGANGQINARSGSSVPLTFTFVEQGTYTPQSIAHFYFTFSDIDERHGGTEKERIKVTGFDRYYTNDDLQALDNGEEVPTFESADFGSVADNDFQPDSTNPIQLSHAVTYMFLDQSTFQATFTVRNVDENIFHKGRNVLFSGISQLVFCQDPSTYLDFSNSVVTMSNLGGMGPMDGAQEIRYSNIAMSDSDSGVYDLDLVVTSDAAFGYHPSNTSQNGRLGDFGQINLYCGPSLEASEAYITFSVVRTGTMDPFVLTAFAFTIFDFDSGLSEAQVEFVDVHPSVGFEGGSGYASYILTSTTEVAVSEAPSGATRFKATHHGTESDNPQSSQMLAREVADKTAVFTFRSTSTWRATLGITPTGFDTGRNFMFSGQDMYLMCD